MRLKRMLGLLLLIVITLSMPDCFAQSNVPINAFAIAKNTSPGITEGTIIISLQDTSDVSQIEVLLGTSDGDNSLANYVFNYDVNSNLPSGFSYNRSEGNVTLGVGSFAESPTLFGKVRLKDSGGQWGDYFAFASN